MTTDTQSAPSTPSGVTAAAILSGQSQPMPNATPATPGTDVGNLPLGPRGMPNLPSPGANGAPLSALGGAAPAQSAQAPPQNRNAIERAAQHMRLGQLASKLFSGTTTDYTIDPQTGQTIATQRKARPGEIFRSILGGALLGIATNDSQRETAMQASPRVIDQQRRAAAQQQFDNQRAAQKDADAATLQKAQLAHAQLETVKYARDLDLHSPDSVDAANASYRTKLQAALDAGGRVPKVMVGGENINGQTGNLSGFYKAYQSNPDAFKAPAGFSRIEVLRTDTSGLHHDEHTDPATGMVTERWLDADNNPVDLDSRSSLTFIDVPRDTADDPQQTPGSEINALHGSNVVDPKGTYNLSLNQKLAISNQAIKSANDSTRARADAQRASASQTRAAKAGASASNPAEKSIRDQIRIATTQLSQSQKNFDDDGAKAAQTKLNSLYDQLDKIKGTTLKVPAGQSVIYDPQGNPHAVSTKLLPQYLKSPAYKGWHE